MTTFVVLAALGIGVGVGRYLLPTGAEGAGAVGVGSASPDAAGETVWACSMHPQIRQPNPGDCPICGMDLIPADEGGGGEAEALREVSISREARALLDLKVAPVERRYVTATVRMVGKVDYDETRLGYITAWVPGRLDRLFVDYTGVEVQEGDHMVSIYSPELYSAQAELIRARQAVEQRRSTTGALGAERLLESAREKLRLWGLTEGQIGQIESQDEPSENLTIYAPMSGIVIQKNVQEGMYVDTGTRIYTISDLSRLWVKLDAYESDLPWLRYGQEVEFTTEAYPGEVFTGTVAFIDPVLDAETRTVKVRVNVPNPSGRLKPDMFVRASVRAQVATAGRVMDPGLVGKWICRMHPGVVKDSAGDCDVCGMPLVRTESLGYVSAASAADESAEPLVVPVPAVLKTGTRAVVYVERPDADSPTYEGREIVLGPRAGDSYIVRAGLEEGERVVTQGNFKLDSALQIAAKPSMMNPDGGLEEVMEEALHAPPSVSRQLARLQEAAGAVRELGGSGDRAATREALRRFEDAVASVDASALQGRAAMAWKELSMRLRNDAVEGRWALSPGRETEAVDRLFADVGRLRSTFGLPDDPGTLLASAPLDVPPAFRDRLGPLWESYLAARDALVADDPEAARASAGAASAALAGIEADSLEGKARDLWDSARGDLDEALARMVDAEDLPALRSAFERWSTALRPVVASIGLAGPVGTVVAHSCSMALDDAGASWLQSGEEVRNPYMGQRMPRCTTGVEVVWDGPPPPAPVEAAPANIPDGFRRQLAGLWDAYLDLQGALASDDPDASRRAAGELGDVLASVDASTLEDDARDAWDRERENLRAAVDRMTEADGIEPLRAGFALMSEEMPVLFEAYRPEVGSPVYRMHCPMAFDGRGAAWLQATEEVRNPYFGSAMIRCATEVERIADARPEGSDRE
ncbi:efflux RND transporter periplasmic adaptor subunit [Tautonia plasticadhaerens]|uniref:efflux RND transporter periplasmic adaptor subunit n=1 Tax=Tautonia plasticadhaerens TaxID=2527974 RepID=UPI0018D24699|nr:efflux RND transporter periplasmic adaptor subunit [Tautonia plasticadhaerens]